MEKETAQMRRRPQKMNAEKLIHAGASAPAIDTTVEPIPDPIIVPTITATRFIWNRTMIDRKMLL